MMSTISAFRSIDRPLRLRPVVRSIRPRVLSSSSQGSGSPVSRSSAVLSADSTQSIDESNLVQAKPFSQIPGPVERPFVGTFFDVVKGKDPIPNFHHSLNGLVQQYGPLVRYSMFGQRRVLVTDPEDIRTVYKHAGKFPRRDAAVPLDMYFKQSGITNSLLTMDGEEWRRQRLLVNPALMRPATIEAYAPRISDTSADLAVLIEQHRDKTTGELRNVDALLLRWALESVGTVVVGTRLGALNTDGSVTERAQRMIRLTEGYLDTFASLFLGLPFYRIPFFGKLTPKWKRFERSLGGLLALGREYVEDKLDRLAKKEDELNPNLKEGGDFVSYMLNKPNVTIKEISEHALQFIAAAGDTTANVALACLYHASVHPEVQEQLRQEILSVVGKEGEVNAEHLSKMPYLRGFIKESFRLWPPTIGTMRILDNDIVLKGYHIPKDTSLFFPAYTLGRDPRNFPEPLKYEPLRWSKGDESEEEPIAATPSEKEPAKCPITGKAAQSEPGPHPFTVLPFGFGARMCIGSKIAYLEIEMVLVHVLRRFRLSYTQERKPNLRTKMLMGADIPVVVNFTPLE